MPITITWTKRDTSSSDVHVGVMASDHVTVRFTLPPKKPEIDTQWITSIVWRWLSHDAFASDLATSRLCGDLTALNNMSADDLAHLYRDVMTDLRDRRTLSSR